MHIPKTAGMSVVKAFERALGKENCRQMTPAVTDADFKSHRFISGHHTLASITSNAWRFTFLRDPLAQLASHLRWLDFYNAPAMADGARDLPPGVRHIVVQVGRTDFGSAAELDALFDWLPADAPVRLANVQSEMLSRHPGVARLSDDRDLADAAIYRLRELDFVGLTEFVQQDMVRLFRRLALPGVPDLRRDNAVSSSRRIDLGDAAIRAVLERRMQADMRLYERVLRRRQAIVLRW